MTYRSHILGLCLLLTLGACQVTPKAQVDQAIKGLDYRLHRVETDQFAHIAIASAKLQTLRGQSGKGGVGGNSDSSVDPRPQWLHVYIEGDGRPWWTRTQISSNPTYGRLVALDLMQRDAAPALYIGRPCYFETEDKHCNPEWWTAKRYSQLVIDSMNAVLDRYSARFRGVRLFGHSGGGALAYLMASERTDVVSVVTVAANLDIDQWADHHGYSRLTASVNPATRQLPEHVIQLHLAGGKDRAVPATLVEQFTLKKTAAECAFND